MKLNMSSHSRRCIWIKLQCVIVRRQWGISSMTVLAAQLTSTIVFVLLLLLAINALSAERREEEGQGGADQTWGRVTISSSPVHTKAVFISPKLQEHASLHFLYQHLLRQLQLKCANICQFSSSSMRVNWTDHLKCSTQPNKILKISNTGKVWFHSKQEARWL